MVALRDRSRSADALAGLAGALETLDLGPDLADLAAERDRLAGTIRSYLIPRSIDPDLPATVVFAGPTGSGKSTLVNTLTGLDLSAVGVIRPTTTAPVVLTSATNAGGYDSIAGVPCQVVTGGAPILGSMALVDTPDIDSTSTQHRHIAETMIDNADIVVFVTSALRYSDAVPWQTLRRAVARGADVVIVLNRVSSATSGAAVDFRSRLLAAGFDDSLITVPEHHLQEGAQRVPSVAARTLARRLAMVSADRRTHAAVTFERVLSSIVDQVGGLTRQVHALADDCDAFEAELSLGLAKRLDRLYTAGVGDGLYRPVPSKSTHSAVRRWRRANAANAGEVSRLESLVVDRLTALVHGDLRRWLAEEAPLGPTPTGLFDEVGPAIASAAADWVLQLRRIAQEVSPSDIWLAEAVLIDAATEDGECAAAALMWSEHGAALVDRARRELIERLDVVYQHAGYVIAGTRKDRRGGLDDTDLRSALGAVSSTLAPVDA